MHFNHLKTLNYSTMVNLYFLHSPYSSAKNSKEKEAAAALRMHADNLVSEMALEILIQQLKSDIEQLNLANKRSRTLSICMSGSITEGHRVLYVDNGTGTSVASIQVFQVKNERY